MYIDFHTHGKLAKKLPLSTRYIDWLFGEAVAAGLDAVCLTEHFNTLQFDEMYRYLVSAGRPEGDTLIVGGLRIFPGMETDIAEGGHILTVGPLDAILDLYARLEPHRERGNFLPFRELLDLFSEYPVLIGAGHPFRKPGHIPELPLEQLQRLDFLDLNGKDAAEDRERTERLTYGMGAKLEKPVVGGSDTHQAVQYGCIRSCFEKDCSTVSGLHEQMLAGRYRIEVRSDAAFRVRTAALLKRALKEVHALGGDYVSVLLEEPELEIVPALKVSRR